MKRILLFVYIALVLAACAPNAVEPSAPAPAVETSDADAVVEEPAVSEAAESAPEASEASPSEAPAGQAAPLPPDPQRIEFQTEDGVTLTGYYYPAEVNPAPMVVLMHWAEGDQTDWLYVGMVSWLQNRGAEVPAASGEKFFDTPYPFPPLPAGQSYGVFTFDFRGHGESGGSQEWEKHILDARAAYQTAAGLEGVDPARVVGIGASIGSDAVVDGCETCVGALSLGPGGFLGVPYPDAAGALDAAGAVAWCVGAQDDQPSAAACDGAGGSLYRKQVYPSGGHAMSLFRASNNLQPALDSVIRDFLKSALNLPE